MRAMMSDKLRKILRDPQGRRELQQALIKLDVTKNKVRKYPSAMTVIKFNLCQQNLNLNNQFSIKGLIQDEYCFSSPTDFSFQFYPASSSIRHSIR